jgi:hypothetical protein
MICQINRQVTFPMSPASFLVSSPKIGQKQSKGIMKIQLACLMVGLMTLGTGSLRAQDDKKPEHPSREEAREKLKNMTPEQRQAAMKEWREKHPNAPGPGGPGGPGGEKFREQIQETGKQLGLNREEMEKLSPEDRRAKFREAAETKAKELRAKKDAGTITADEQKFLDRLDMMKKRGEEFRRQHEENGGKEGKADPRDARKPAIQEEKK